MSCYLLTCGVPGHLHSPRYTRTASAQCEPEGRAMLCEGIF